MLRGLRNDMASNFGTGDRKGLTGEITGIVLIAAALYTGLSVFSALSGTQKGGVAGQYVSALLFKAIGYSSCILPLLLLAAGFKLLLRRVLSISAAVPASIAVFMAAASGLMAGVSGGATGTGKAAGGMAGDAITHLLVRHAGRAGALLILVSLLVASVLAFSITLKLRRAHAPDAHQPTDAVNDTHNDAYHGDEDDTDGYAT